MNRRHFLQGAGGFMLALPFLPSLMPRAFAAPGQDKFFIFMVTPHGGINAENIWPAHGPAVQEEVLFAGSSSSGLDHRMRYGRLADLLTVARPVDGSIPAVGSPLDPEAQLSPVLGSFLNPMLDKINLIRGLDFMWYSGHHGASLGNFQRAVDGGGPNGSSFGPTASIDQVMAQSTSFYQAGDAFRHRSVVYSANGNTFQSPSWRRNGSAIEAVPGFGHNPSLGDRFVNTLYDHLFNGVSATPPPPGDPRPMGILNRIVEDYRRLARGASSDARRLSSEDRARLENHLDQLSDIESRIEVGGLACTPPGRSSTNYEPWSGRPVNDHRLAWDVINRTVAAALNCGISRVFVFVVPDWIDFSGSTISGDYHQEVAHQHRDADAQALLVRKSRRYAQYLFGDLVNKLDAVSVPTGGTLLDAGLVMYQHEAGEWTHDGFSMPTLLAGSAGGVVQTGQYLDYRNLSNLGLTQYHANERPGLPMNRMLATILTAMGVPRSDWGMPVGVNGYGDPFATSFVRSGHTAYPTRVRDSSMNDPLPRLFRTG